MAYHPPITVEKREAIASDLAGSSLTVSQICAKHSVSPPTVYRINKARLSGTGFRPSQRVHVTDEKRDQIIAEYREALLSTPQIAKKYGVSTSTVTRLAKDAGVARRTGRRVSESPVELAAGAWVYGSDGIARWVPNGGVA